MANRDDDFLSRWSRRKADAKSGLKKTEPVDVKAPLPDEQENSARRASGEAGAAEESQGLPVKEASVSYEMEVPTAESILLEENEETVPVFQTPASQDDLAVEDEEVKEAFKDVDFEKLNYASDYSRFMEKDVPEAIRRRALRMLWGSNPILANIDGLNDYDEDFTDAALAIKIVGSNYTPGSGYLSEEELEASYSEEARKAGRPPEEDEEEEQELSDVEDIDDSDDFEGDEDGELDDLDTEEFGEESIAAGPHADEAGVPEPDSKSSETTPPGHDDKA